MCDVKKYSDIYKEIAKLNPKDTLQLVLESETEEEKDFYEMVGDFLLQKRQKEVVERNLFWVDEKVYLRKSLWEVAWNYRGRANIDIRQASYFVL